MDRLCQSLEIKMAGGASLGWIGALLGVRQGARKFKTVVALNEFN